MVKGRKPGLKSTVWSRRKKETFNQKRMKQQEVKKMRRGLGTPRTSLNERSNIWIIGIPEGEEEEQEIENLFENTIEENFPNLAKEIVFQEVQEAQRVPRKHIPGHITTTLPKIKDKERTLNEVGEKETVTYKG